MTNARELTAYLAELLRREHHAMADFLVALADFDRRRLWSELGYTGLFMFLHRELGLSKGASHYRKTAADLVQRVPEVIEPLRDGRLCITSVVELAKVLTPENHGEVLPRFFHRSKREAMEIKAELRPDPAPPKRDVVTAVPLVLPAEATAEPTRTRAAVQLANLPDANSPPAERVMMSRPDDRRDVAVPLTADLRRLHVTVSRRFMEKLDAARDALSHSHPGAEIEEILEAGLDLVLAERARRKGLVAKPRKEPPRASPDSDHVPAHVKRAVWLRDGGRCQFRLENGGICGSTHQLELDHVRPRALGGPSTIENIRLACRPHNGLAARQVFGDAWMDRFTRRAQRGYSGAAASAHSRLISTDPPGSGWSPSASVSGRARNQA
jgi:hypothetical protein